MEMGESENGNGYNINRDKPPEDDCCPICFDAFRFPCRTTCGHWFCSSCILLHWTYLASFRPCKCPLCGCSITKLVPQSSMLIDHPREEVSEILKTIRCYNRFCSDGWRGLFLKLLALPLLIRRNARQFQNPLILDYICYAARVIGIVLGILYDYFDLHFFPYGGLGIQILFEICGCALTTFLVLDVLWYRWMRSRRARWPPNGVINLVTFMP